VIVDLIVVQDLNLAFRNIYWTVVENLKLAFGIYESFVLAFARTFDGCSFLFVWRQINPVRCHNSNSTTKKTQHTHPSPRSLLLTMKQPSSSLPQSTSLLGRTWHTVWWLVHLAWHGGTGSVSNNHRSVNIIDCCVARCDCCCRCCWLTPGSCCAGFLIALSFKRIMTVLGTYGCVCLCCDYCCRRVGWRYHDARIILCWVSNCPVARTGQWPCLFDSMARYNGKCIQQQQQQHSAFSPQAEKRSTLFVHRCLPPPRSGNELFGR
jgi:hypothetical protein